MRKRERRRKGGQTEVNRTKEKTKKALEFVTEKLMENLMNSENYRNGHIRSKKMVETTEKMESEKREKLKENKMLSPSSTFSVMPDIIDKDRVREVVFEECYDNDITNESEEVIGDSYEHSEVKKDFEKSAGWTSKFNVHFADMFPFCILVNQKHVVRNNPRQNAASFYAVGTCKNLSCVTFNFRTTERVEYPYREINISVLTCSNTICHKLDEVHRREVTGESRKTVTKELEIIPNLARWNSSY